MDCEFCSVTKFNGFKYRQRPVDDVLDELESIPQKMIFFVDDNILGYGKDANERTIKLFKGMINRKINIRMGTNKYKDIINKINSYKIAVLGAFIYGLDNDTIESIQRRIEYIIRSQVDVMQTAGKVIFSKFFKTLLSTKSLSASIWACSSNFNYRNVARSIT